MNGMTWHEIQWADMRWNENERIWNYMTWYEWMKRNEIKIKFNEMHELMEMPCTWYWN